mmetsp:Transcript_31514/g.80354  ORF Transcript_31514/g.80354 Transcript_31514/m.80354 type:complete len:276 (-) Transcript_31514:393-1220(-)
MPKVQLAVSSLGGIPGVTAYHSSVIVDGEEFSFGAATGMVRAKGAASHGPVGGRPKIIEYGHTTCSPKQLASVMSPHFRSGTYDLLRKNCNSFSDCALYVLLRKRLGTEYRTLEQLGAQMPALVQAVSAGQYSPNPKSSNFNLEDTVKELSKSGNFQRPDAPLEPNARGVSAPQPDSTVMLWEAAGALQGAAGAFWEACRPLWDSTQEDELLARRLQADEFLNASEQYARSLQREQPVVRRAATGEVASRRSSALMRGSPHRSTTGPLKVSSRVR